MKEVILRNEEEVSDFILDMVDSSIAMNLLCLNEDGISADKITDIAVSVIKYMYKLTADAGLKSNGFNVNTCVSLIIFTSAIKAHNDYISSLAKDMGIDLEVLLSEMRLSELSLLKNKLNNSN